MDPSPIAPPAPQSDYEKQLRAANEVVYKHGLELAIKNKTLLLLGQLYEIGITALKGRELAEKVTGIIRSEFNFEIVGILAYDTSRDTLHPLAVATSERIHSLELLGNMSLEAVNLEGVSKQAFYTPVVAGNAYGYTQDLKDIWYADNAAAFIEAAALRHHVRSSLVYPLLANGTLIGVSVIALNRVYAELVEYEKEAIKSFVNVIAMNLDKIMLYEELGTMNAQQENLLHFISHEIKGYLTKSEAGFAAIAQGDVGVVPPGVKNLAQAALDDVRKGVATVMDILDASNLKKGTVSFKKDRFDFKSAVEAVVAQQKGAVEEKKLTIDFKESGGKYEMNGDEDKLREHVIHNLIDNAIRYTPQGSISVELSDGDGKIHFSVTDSGVGITPEDMTRLFTEGGHGKDSIKVNVHSTGYGLFIAKQVVEAHGGRIWAESNGAGKGATFRVELPTA